MTMMLGLYSSQLRTHTSYHWLRWPDVLELTSHTACIKDSCSVSSSSVMSYVLVGSSRLWRRTLDTYQVFWMICCPRWQQWKVAVHAYYARVSSVLYVSWVVVASVCCVMWCDVAATWQFTVLDVVCSIPAQPLSSRHSWVSSVRLSLQLLHFVHI